MLESKLPNQQFVKSHGIFFVLQYKYLVSLQVLKPSELLIIYYNWQDMMEHGIYETMINYYNISIISNRNNLVQHWYLCVGVSFCVVCKDSKYGVRLVTEQLKFAAKFSVHLHVIYKI